MIKKVFFIITLFFISFFSFSVSADEEFCPLAKAMEDEGHYTMSNSLYDECIRNSKDVVAMHKLASNYYSGLGFGKSNYTVAASLFERAAHFGYTPAQIKIAVLYWRGEGVSKNLQKAYFWLYIASKSDDNNAKSYMGRLASEVSSEEVAIAIQNAEKWLTDFKERQNQQ